MKIMQGVTKEIKRGAFWGVLTTVVAIGVVGGFGLLFLRANVLHEEQKRVTSKIADRIGCYAEEYFLLISNISSHHDVRVFFDSGFNQGKKSEVVELLDLVCHFNKDITVFILDREGKVVATESGYNAVSVGGEHGLRQYFIKALAGANFVYGSFDSVVSEKSIYFSSPFYKHDNSIGGVIVIKADAKIFDSIIGDVETPVLILNHSDDVFYSNRKDLSYKGLKGSKERLIGINFFRRLANIRVPKSEEHSLADAVKYEGKKYLFREKEVPLAGWRVITLWDAKNKYPIYNIDSKLIFTILVLFVAMGVLSAFSFVNSRKRKKAEISLIESEHRYRDLAETLPLAVFETDSSWKLMYANRATFDTFEVDSEFANSETSIGNFISENRRLETAAELDKFARDSEHDILIAESELVKSSGAVFTGDLYIKRLFSAGCFSGFRVVVVDITHVKKVENELKKTLNEKEFLLREIHHRVKNNLQIISSLLHLQLKKMKDPDVMNAINESRSRVKTMALIHQQLYQSSSIERINIGDYIKALVKNLVHTYSCNAINITIDYKIEDISLTVDKAISCGLIVNELISNALKYAFADKKSGLLQIELKEVGDKTVLMVSDDGVGLPEDYDFKLSATLGVKLVQTLAEQLGGTVEFKTGKGVKCTITF